MILLPEEYKVPDLFNSWEDDPISKFLGGKQWKEFKTRFGVGGLAFVELDLLLILAIHADSPGQGQFKAFLARAKEVFNIIVFLEVTNKRFKQGLAKRGFVAARIMINEDRSDITRGMTWKKAK